MRIFIAIELPEVIKREISRIQNKMASPVNKIKWVDSASMHITLKFLGETEEKKLTEVFGRTKKVADEFNPFFVRVKGTGAFPHAGNPRVIWMGIEEGSDELIRMVEELERELSGCGFPKEKKKWVPHITVGRVKKLKDVELIKKLISREKQTPGGKMRAEDITVMQSRLTPQGAVYTPLKHFPL